MNRGGGVTFRQSTSEIGSYRGAGIGKTSPNVPVAGTGHLSELHGHLAPPPHVDLTVSRTPHSNPGLRTRRAADGAARASDRRTLSLAETPLRTDLGPPDMPVRGRSRQQARRTPPPGAARPICVTVRRGPFHAGASRTRVDTRCRAGSVDEGPGARPFGLATRGSLRLERKLSICPKLIVRLQIDLRHRVSTVPVRPIGQSKPAGVATRPGAGERGRSCGAASARYWDGVGRCRRPAR